MRLKANTLFFDAGESGETEDLEAAAVSEHGAGPVHEAVQSAEIADDAGSRPQIEMVGVGQNDAGAELEKILLRQRLDGRLSAHRHEHWCLHGAVGGVEQPRARAAALVPGDDFESNRRARSRRRHWTSSETGTKRWPRDSRRGSTASNASSVCSRWCPIPMA